MNRSRTFCATIALLSAVALGALAQSESNEIKVTAKKFEFSPSAVHVKKGDRVKLVITAADHDHGFKLEAFQVDQLLKKGEATTVEFTADRAGTFPFECSHFCGMGHKKMKGELVVE
ncbi:MAG TPA: cupredoxin domain-containing protein [Bryobacteraceae bacterium]|jgi:cytochrome c oxidase subunit II|nr:cupredoxin domain-containing protein [Bryobacteraceae bacterium]